jgi:hypothetical protein
MTNPLAFLQGDIDQLRGIHPLERARVAQEQVDAVEERRAEAQRQAQRDKFENDLARMAAIERAEIARQGYTTAELHRHQAAEQAERAERIAALETELNRLDPARAAVSRFKLERGAAETAERALLERARTPDEFMQAEVRRFEQRREADELRRMGAEQARLERGYSGYGAHRGVSGYYDAGEITRGTEGAVLGVR